MGPVRPVRRRSESMHRALSISHHIHPLGFCLIHHFGASASINQPPNIEIWCANEVQIMGNALYRHTRLYKVHISSYEEISMRLNGVGRGYPGEISDVSDYLTLMPSYKPHSAPHQRNHMADHLAAWLHAHAGSSSGIGAIAVVGLAARWRTSICEPQARRMHWHASSCPWPSGNIHLSRSVTLERLWKHSVSMIVQLT